jgi:hypothetical protein
MLDNLGYKHMFRICNTYCFSTATQLNAKDPQCFIIHTLPLSLPSLVNAFIGTMYIIVCIFTCTCSQKHNNMSDSITM